ncbi:DUF3806 domain-containing protein [Persicirhabdus sediminis]|uniref:DUF3806 domain-containing protein n=1 Tax=Persicirhabdus sediminis TaxID=454144 RepID=A0A8J7MET4_9BACT|nr:DUF3806 domain-containing protein [Persicirhabdus sediminis]MBK1791407.1 DUF3806 domain-containing protein [Persicirhabdus sediminis]
MNEDTPANFEPDAKMQQLATNSANSAIEFARSSGLTLDQSDASIAVIESILDSLHKQIKEANPSDEQITSYSRMLGCYLGETFRINHGATWGLITLGEQRMPGLQFTSGSGQFWPWVKVQQRLVDGPAHNVVNYYNMLLEQTSPSS